MYILAMQKNKKYLEKNENENNTPKLVQNSEAVLREKFIRVNVNIKKKKALSPVNNFTP